MGKEKYLSDGYSEKDAEVLYANEIKSRAIAVGLSLTATEAEVIAKETELEQEAKG
ncbi:MAG TPA: hypothetical protein VD905_15525 [Flavobacteriales bacterium]|nr:hypothetical protein [Flavobacteriales bacterium]